MAEHSLQPVRIRAFGSGIWQPAVSWLSDRSYYTIAFSPDGQQLIAGGQVDDDGSGVDVWRPP